MNSLDKLKDEFELEIKMENQPDEVDNTKVRRLEERMNETEKEIKTLKDENDKHVRQTEHLGKELYSSKKDNEQLNQKIRRLKEELTQKDKTIQSETKAKTTLKAQMNDGLDAAKKQIEHLQTRNKTSTREYKAQTEELGVQINELKSELTKKKNELDTLTAKEQLNTKEIEEKNLQLQMLTNTKGDQSKMIEELKRDKQHLNQQVQATNKIKEEQSQMIDNLKRAKRDVEEKMSAQLTDTTRIIKTHEEQREKMSIELGRLKQITSKRVISST